jgi:hypothetical protein
MTNATGQDILTWACSNSSWLGPVLAVVLPASIVSGWADKMPPWLAHIINTLALNGDIIRAGVKKLASLDLPPKPPAAVPAFLLAALFIPTLLLGGCANPPAISTNPIQSAGNIVNTATGGATSGATSDVSQDILNAQTDFNQAVQLGILPATDPAPQCLNSVASLLGVGGTAAAQFTPTVSGIVSAGAVGYIYIQQLKQLTGGTLTVPPACLQLIGQIVIDASKAGLQLGGAATAIGLVGTTGLPALPLPLQRPVAPQPRASYYRPSYQPSFQYQHQPVSREAYLDVGADGGNLSLGGK